MNPAAPSLSDVVWTPALAAALADAAAAVAALDARVSASSYAAAWDLRARWTGYAQALRLQRQPFEEIDIMAAACGIHIPGRLIDSTTQDPLDGFAAWQDDLGNRRGWDAPEALPQFAHLSGPWAGVPVLARALALLDAHARDDGSATPWLALPLTLCRLGVTRRPLPCLVIGDASQRVRSEPRAALLMRLLKHMRGAADDGLSRLDRLEATARRNAAAVGAEHRAGKLLDLARITLGRPCLGARSLAPLVGLTISGAGKLLERAARLAMLVEISGRETWRTYVAPDVALALGLVAPARGRPPLAPAPAAALDPVLRAFDDEMAEIEAQLARLAR